MTTARDEAKKNVAKERYEKYQKELDGKARHAFKGCVSAARILFGAYSAGDIDSSTLREAAEALKKAERENYGRDAYIDIKDYISLSEPHQKTLKGENSLSNCLRKRKLLFIDDEYKKVGWNVVFDALCGSGKVLYADTIGKGWSIIDAHSFDIAAILLDMRLPSVPEEGLGFLKEIKNRFLDLPVIMFTAEDSSKHVKKCFQYGAFDYFVKEFEGGDRDSLDYYLKLKEVLIEAFSQEAWREICGKIFSLEDKLKKHGPPYYQEPIYCLKKAYFFLTTDTESWTANTLLSRYGLTPYGEVIVQCALAMELIINELFIQNKNNKQLKTLFAEGALDNMTLAEKIKRLLEIKALSKGLAAKCSEINKRRIECVHPTNRTMIIPEGTARATLADTTALLNDIIFTKLLVEA